MSRGKLHDPVTNIPLSEDDLEELDRLKTIIVNQNQSNSNKSNNHSETAPIPIKYDNDNFSYIICPQNLKKGDTVLSSDKADIKVGNCLQLRNVPTDTIIHNIEMKPGKGGQLIRSAGTFSQLVGRDQGMAIIRLTSGEQRLILAECYATIGAVSNPDNSNQKLAKAGRNRWKGKRPSVRGVVMNPVDHPHGGGEGKTSGGRSPVSPWGQSAKGLKTRRPKRSDNLIISRRKKRNK